MSAFLFDAGVLYKVSYKNGELARQSIAAPMRSSALVACFSSEEFYFVDRDLPHILQRWKVPLNCTKHTLSCPVHKVLVHCQKVYCCGRDVLHVFDPLSEEIEVLKVHRDIIDMEAAEHGFVFLGGDHELYTFKVTGGARKVEGGKNARLLGRYNNHVVALVGSERILCVNENGEVRENFFPSSIRTPFICLGAGDMLAFNTEGALCFYAHDQSLTVSEIRGTDPKLLSLPTAQAEDSCIICLCDFGDGGGVTLDCGHCFHRDCLAEFSSRADSFRARGEHVVFTYAVCPGGCGLLVRHAVAPLSKYMELLFREITSDAEIRIREMGNKTMEDLLYYICNRCENPFYGGERRCFRSNNNEPAKDPKDLICSNCNSDFLCPQHKHNYVLYKCRYCCNPATHLSFGNRYLCNRCDGRWENTEPDPIPCPGPEKCPLKASHGTVGSIPLDCMLCETFPALDSILFSNP